jgi:pyridoxal 5'-phosphate synthase pdxT subunit
MSSKIIGILALQGDFEKHRQTLENLDAQTLYVKTPEQLEQADALVLPGGESTTIIKLMQRNGLDAAIKQRAEAGMPVFGTCAGLILMAKSIQDRPEQPTLDLLPVTVARNAFGRQLDSFEADIPFEGTGDSGQEAGQPQQPHTPFVRGVFIRAPYVTETAPDVEILSQYDKKIVGVRQGAKLGIAFHPELTDDSRIHALFVDMVEHSAEER